MFPLKWDVLMAAVSLNTVQVAFSGPSNHATNEKSPSVILVGCSDIYDMLNQTQVGLPLLLDDRAVVSNHTLEFVTDQAITRLDGSQLIPYAFQCPERELTWKVKALLPESSSHFVTSTREAFSSGFCKGAGRSFHQLLK